jgi:hypothetical protein
MNLLLFQKTSLHYARLLALFTALKTGKLVERQGRKATGLRVKAYGSGVASNG